MEYIKIKEKTYGYAVNFKDNDSIRNSFNSLTRKIYGFILKNGIKMDIGKIDTYLMHY